MSYLAAMFTLVAIVATAAWFISGAFGVEGEARILVTGQAPVLVVMILWALAIIFPVKQRPEA